MVNLSSVDCTGHRTYFSLAGPPEEWTRLSLIIMTWACGACTPFRYTNVSVTVMSSIGKHIEITSNGKSSDIGGKVKSCGSRLSEVTHDMSTWNDVGHVEFIIIKFGVIRL